jgi:phosphonatase-like hydrolase
MGYPKPEAIRILLEAGRNDPKLNLEYLADKIHSDYREWILNYYKKDEGVTEKKGVTETFRVLRENNIRIGIDTGFDRLTANTIFERLGWDQNKIFDFSVTSDEVENGRPFPDMIYKCMTMCNIRDAKWVAKIGDTVSDLEQGTAAGCNLVIGVTTGAYTYEELAKAPHTHLIREIPELIGILGL